jgi:hypothetical protein
MGNEGHRPAGEDELIQSAMVIRETAPEAWENFVRAAQLYAAGIARDMVKAEPELLFRAQGQAQMAARLATTLKDAPELFEAIRARRQKNVGISSTNVGRPYRG